MLSHTVHVDRKDQRNRLRKWHHRPSAIAGSAVAVLATLTFVGVSAHVAEAATQPPSITSSTSDAITQGVTDSFKVTTTGSPIPAISESGALPSGIAFTDHGNGTATMSGDATVSGTFPIIITANNSVSPNATQSFTLTVNPPPTTWTQLSPQTTPGNLAQASMAYDPATSQLILFGGQTSTNNFVNGTWSWNGTTWAQLSPSTSPSPRSNASMAYDAATGQLLLFGGEGSGTTYLNDTWVWNGSTWTQLSPATSPPVRDNASMAYDPATSQFILFGGLGNSTSTGSDTWSWNGSTWTQLSPTTSPSSRFRAPLTYDPATSQLVLFGGSTDSNSAPLGDTWDWTGSNWNQLTPATSPPARGYGALTFDPMTEQLVLFGGVTTGITSLGDTWNWSGTTWEQLTPANSPSKRSRVVTAYDPATSQLLLYGGFGKGAFLGDTWNYSAVPAVAPTAPTIGTATAGNSQATVTFNPPSNNGGAAVTSYTVTANDLTKSANGGQMASGSESPLTVTGLTNGDTYTFTVTATNSVGKTGPASVASNSVVPATVPGAPAIGTATAGAGQATVSFSPPTSDGGSAVKSYTATATDLTTPANGGQTQPGTASPLTVTGLTNGDTYTFRVTATNGVGTGSPSMASNAVVIGGGITSVTPSQIVQGSKTDVLIDGFGFTSPVSVTISGGGVTPTLISATSTAITIKAKVSSSAALGARTVTVTTGNGSFVCSNCLTIIASMTFTGMNPSSVALNSNTDVTLTGSGFAPGATIKGPKHTLFTNVSVVSSTTITAVLSVSSTAKPGSGLPVIVSNSASEGKKKVTSDVLTITGSAGSISPRTLNFPKIYNADNNPPSSYADEYITNTTNSDEGFDVFQSVLHFSVANQEGETATQNGNYCQFDGFDGGQDAMFTVDADSTCAVEFVFFVDGTGPGHYSVQDAVCFNSDCISLELRGTAVASGG
jgi:fibronectin type III domain protein/galactose oxidase-like protein